MKKILITGVSGFLGSNLCEKLLQDEQNKVIGLDNFYSSSYENIKKFEKNPNFEFIEHDIVNPIDINVDEIYNLACPASPVFYKKDPLQTMKSSVYGIFNLLELTKRYSAKILQTSTSEVYGDPLIHPQTEDYWGNVNPIGSRSCYDEGKRAAETILCDCARKYSTPARIARIFNTYGPNMQQNDGRVVSNFIVQALRGEDITVYGKGEQTRSFCYVDDLIMGLIKLMNTQNVPYYPINLGNPDEHKIIDIAKIIIKKTNSKSKISYKEIPEDDPKVRRPDTSLALNILNWSASTPLDIGLDKTIAYFKEIVK